MRLLNALSFFSIPFPDQLGNFINFALVVGFEISVQIYFYWELKGIKFNKPPPRNLKRSMRIHKKEIAP